MTFVRKDANRKGWKPGKTGADNKKLQIYTTSDQKKLMYITLEDVVNIDQEASLMLNTQVKDMCLKLWWLNNNYGCWRHFFKAHISWAKAKSKLLKPLGSVTDPETGKPLKVYTKE